MSYSEAQIWTLIAVTGIGTFLIRFSFLGLIGNRPLRPLTLRLLRYTPVAVIPGLVAPTTFTPLVESGNPTLLVAGAVTILIGWRTKILLAGFFSGLLTYYGLVYLSSV